MTDIRMIDLDAAPPSRPSRSPRRIWTTVLVVGLFVAGALVGITARHALGDRPAERVAGAPRVQADAGADAFATGGQAPRHLPVSARTLAGIWLSEPDSLTGRRPMLVRFSADGTYALGGAFAGDASVTGTFQARATGVTFLPEGGACEASEQLAWSVTLPAEGRLEAVHLGSVGGPREQIGRCAVRIGESYRFVRVSPHSPATGGIVPGYRTPDGAVTAAGAPDLAGYWLVAGTGMVLWLDDTGRYVLDGRGALATEPFDAGTVEVGAGRVRFVSDAAGSGCAVGAPMFWDRVRIEDGAVRATVTEDGCARPLGRVGTDLSLLWLDADALTLD